MDTLILDAIVKYQEKGPGGANLLYLEQKFPELEQEEIFAILDRLLEDGEIVRENYLYYAKN